MKINLFTLLFLLTATQVLAQVNDTIKIKLVSGEEIIPGATVLKGLSPPRVTTTNIDGIATLIIPNDKSLVEISFTGPYVRLKIERPADSIFFDVNSTKATFYHNKKRIKTRKQIVRGY